MILYMCHKIASPAKPSFFGRHRLKKESARTAEYNSIVSVITKEGLAGLEPSQPSFGMTTTKI